MCQLHRAGVLGGGQTRQLGRVAIARPVHLQMDDELHDALTPSVDPVGTCPQAGVTMGSRHSWPR